jgi:hypothetical protein
MPVEVGQRVDLPVKILFDGRHSRIPKIHVDACTGSRHRTRLQGRGCGHNLWDVICRTAEPLAWDRRERPTSKEVERSAARPRHARRRTSFLSFPRAAVLTAPTARCLVINQSRCRATIDRSASTQVEELGVLF